MNEPKADNIVKRLDRLERENRRIRLVGTLLLVGIVALVVMGQSKSKVAKVIEAEKFVLRDGGGRERAALEVDMVGNAKLHVLYPTGGTAIQLTSGTDGSSLMFFGTVQTVREATLKPPLQVDLTAHNAGLAS